MKIDMISLRGQWQRLNSEINQRIKVTQQNTLAGYPPSQEYNDWLQDKIALRNEINARLEALGDYAVVIKKRKKKL